MDGCGDGEGWCIGDMWGCPVPLPPPKRAGLGEGSGDEEGMCMGDVILICCCCMPPTPAGAD